MEYEEMQRIKGKRRCRLCNAPLSLYNDSGICFHHNVKKKRGEIADVGTCEILPRLEGARTVITGRHIVDAVCTVYGFDPKNLKGHTTKGSFAVEVRQVIAYLVREDIKSSYTEIGRLLGMNHTTMIHSCRKVRIAYATNVATRNKIDAVRALCAKMMGGNVAAPTALLPLRPIDTGDIIESVATLFSLEKSLLFSRSRIESIRLPRQIATYLIRECLGQSLPEIGLLLNQDHATVLHSCRKIQRAVQVQGPIRSAVEEVLAQLA